MKRKMFVLIGALMLMAACTKNETMLMDVAPEISAIPTALEGEGSSSGSAESLLDMVPETNRENFLNSFIYDENGVFRGAEIEFLRPFLTETEIIDLVSDLGNISDRQIIFQGYKPKPRGCKQNSRWICVVYGDEVRQ